MLFAMPIVLFLLWAVGLAMSYTMGGLIHILLAVAVLVVLVQVIRDGERTSDMT